MRELTTDEISPYWESRENMEPEEAPDLVQHLERKQPHVLSYLLATGGDILKQEERAVVFYMGVLMWYVVDSNEIDVPLLTLESLVTAEEKNFKMLEYLAGEPDSEFMVTVEKIMVHYNQAALLKYIIEKLLAEPHRDSDINEGHIGVMAIYLKTVIDCVDAVT